MDSTLPRLDKNRIVITDRDDIEEEKEYWLSQTPEERWEATENIRRMVYGEDACDTRIQKKMEYVKLK